MCAQLSPIILGLRAYEASLPKPNWMEETKFPDNVIYLARIQYIQNILYSMLILLGWFKLFDYLSVFPKLYRLIVIIEMVPRTGMALTCAQCPHVLTRVRSLAADGL